MKVLLTGANGFVGSHILDRLVERGCSTAVLLRPGSDTSFIAGHLSAKASLIEVRRGSIEDPATLPPALENVTHVIHCAGRTKACKTDEFYATNQRGTRNVVDAVNANPGQVERLVHVSSLAVSGPGTVEQPAREEGPTRPVSDYGRSKLAGEQEVLNHCKVDFTVVRPPAVYGPRDRGFFSMFQAVQSHLLPRTNSSQALSLVYVEDLAEAVLRVLDAPSASKKIYFAAHPKPVTGREMAEEIAKQLRTWTVPVPLPAVALWPMCLLQEGISKVTGKARLLNLQKFAELRAPGWVCDCSRLQKDVGWFCPTDLREGVARTLAWYQQNRWL